MLYREYHASFFQIGRAYPYKDLLNSPAANLLETIKATLDEKSLMNKGVLGLGVKNNN